MTSSESRATWVAGVILLTSSLIRLGYETAGHPPLVTDSLSIVDTLLAESSRLLAESEERGRALGPGERIDPNRATEAQLDRLPGVGPSTAAEIVRLRALGPLARPEDLLAVKGLGPATLEKIRVHLEWTDPPRVLPRSGATTPMAGRVDPVLQLIPINSASGAELERLPGIGPALAARILLHRSEKGPFRRVEDLLEVRGIGPATLERLRSLVQVH